MSSRFVPHETTVGSDTRTPPSDFHPDQFEPSHAMCHKALSVPTVKTSIRLGPHDTATGGDSRMPPRDSHAPHCFPSHHRCQQALSVPTAKMSSRLALQETALGTEVRTPPSDSQLPAARSSIDFGLSAAVIVTEGCGAPKAK